MTEELDLNPASLSDGVYAGGGSADRNNRLDFLTRPMSRRMSSSSYFIEEDIAPVLHRGNRQSSLSIMGNEEPSRFPMQRLRTNRREREENKHTGSIRSRNSDGTSDTFGDFPPQIMDRSKKRSPQRTNGHSSYSDSLSPSSPQVLVLGPRDEHGQRSLVSKFCGPSSLDFSMVATPGGTKPSRTENSELAAPVACRSSGSETTSSASSGLWVSGAVTPFRALLRGVVSSTPANSYSLSQSSTPYTAARESLPVAASSRNTLEEADFDECTALMFARSAPLSGYLRKLGKNIHSFKRRFFVLKPSTHLYYFMSPTDVEPRGCIDLDLHGGECEVREIGTLPDGTFRFELLFNVAAEDGSDEHNNRFEKSFLDNDLSETDLHSESQPKERLFQRRSVVLEARTEEIGREWMAKLQSERLSSARDEIDFLKTTIAEIKATNSQWERLAFDERKRAEQAEDDRDAAAAEAKAWKTKYDGLNRAIQLLVESLITSPTLEKGTSVNEDCKSSDCGRNCSSEADKNTSVLNTSIIAKKQIVDSESLSKALDELNIHDTRVSELSKYFLRLQSDYIGLFSDLIKSEQCVVEVRKHLSGAVSRYTKAEAELCSVLEDNRALQKDLKKTRRQKKVLVKEVRSLHAAAEGERKKEECEQRSDCITLVKNNSARHSPIPSFNSQSTIGAETSGDASVQPLRRQFAEEEKRLVFELEEHVMSGLRLSEQFLTLNGVAPFEEEENSQNNNRAGRSTFNRTPNQRPLPFLSGASEDFFLARTVKAKNDGFRSVMSCEEDDHSFPEHSSSTGTFDVTSSQKKDEIFIKNSNQSMDGSVASASLALGSQNGDYLSSLGDGNSVRTSIGVVDSLQDTCHSKECRHTRGENDSTSISQNLNDRFTSASFTPLTSYGHTDNKLLDKTTTDVCSDFKNHNKVSELNIQPISKLDEASIHLNALPLDGTSSISESSRSRVTDNGHATTKLECSLRDVGENSFVIHPGSTLGDDGKMYHITFYSKKIGLQFQKIPVDNEVTGLLTDAMTSDHGSSVKANQTTAELRRVAAFSQHTVSPTRATTCLPAAPVDAVLVCGFIGFDESTGNVRPRLGARLVAFDGISVEVGQWKFENIKKSIQARGRPLTLSFRNDFLNQKQREILTKAVEQVGLFASPAPSLKREFRSNANIEKEKKTNNTSIDEEHLSIASDSSLFSQNLHSSNYYSFSETGSSNAFSSAMVPFMSNLMIGISSKKVKHEEFTPNYLKRQSDSLEKIQHHHDFKSSLL